MWIMDIFKSNYGCDNCDIFFIMTTKYKNIYLTSIYYPRGKN